jgi:hypothetical protein
MFHAVNITSPFHYTSVSAEAQTKDPSAAQE